MEVGGEASCDDAAPLVPWIKPWADFEGCQAEAAGPPTEPLSVALSSGCAKEPWLRVNCRASCGLCNLSLVEALRLPPPAALAAARDAAAVGRHGRASRESARARFKSARGFLARKRGSRSRGRGRGRGARS